MKILETTRGLKSHLKEDYLSFTHKRCNECKEVLEVSLFRKKKTKRTKQGWSYSTSCIECCRKYTRNYGSQNKEARNKRGKKFREANPEKTRLGYKKATLRKKYRLTIEELEALKNANGNKCWICNKESKKLYVDHCHTTQKTRGILCPNCNTFLGRVEDNTETVARVILYLQGKPLFAENLLTKVNEGIV